MQQPHVHRIPAAAPDDVSGLTAAFRSGAIDPGSIVAVLGKTVGNGCINDFTRGFATLALTLTLVSWPACASDDTGVQHCASWYDAARR